MTAPLQLFPELDAATEAALRESIVRFGVVVPVVVDQHGRTVDGHHRSRIAAELGVTCPTVVHEVADEEEAVALAAELNTARRHLTVDQRRAIVAVLREAGHSLRAIAGAVGADKKTVSNDLSGGDYSPPETVNGTDGKTYPATRASLARERQAAIDEGNRQAIIAAGFPDPNTVTDEDMAPVRERTAALAPFAGACRHLAATTENHDPAEFAVKWGDDITWPRVMPAVIAARDWLNTFTKEMGY